MYKRDKVLFMFTDETIRQQSPDVIRAGLEPDTFHGQHFLINPNIVDAIIGQIPPSSNVVEIGAGTGVLTEPLVKRVGQHGQVIAYEIDERCMPFLGRLRSSGNLTVLGEDFLNVEEHILNELDTLQLVGNVPYHILEPLLRMMIDIEFEQAILMLPNRFRDMVMARHAGEREWRKSTIIATAFFKIEPIIDAPRDAFVKLTSYRIIQL